MDPDQDQSNFGPDLDPNHLTLIVFSKELFEKDKFEKKVSRRHKLAKLPSMQIVNAKLLSSL